MKKTNFLNRILIISVVIYFAVIILYMICSYFVHAQGLEFRSNISELRVFWLYKLSFVVAALFLITVYVDWRKTQIELGKQKYADIMAVLGILAYGLFTFFLIIFFIFCGAWDVEREVMLDTGYLRVQDQFFPDAGYYYCIPVNKYLREPLTATSEILLEEYESND